MTQLTLLGIDAYISVNLFWAIDSTLFDLITTAKLNCYKARLAAIANLPY